MRLPAPAKINLYLKVLGRRPDGYHELDSVMARLSLADRVRLVLEPGSGPDRLLVDNRLPTGLPPDFDGPGNLALRAVARFRERRGWPQGGVLIELEKNIPLGAGLGGGSSDGAAVLKLLNRAAPEPLAAGELAALGLSLGADLPFFLQDRPLARCGGVGEKTGEPPAHFQAWAGREIVLLNPGLGLSTAAVFRQLGLEPGAPANLGLTKQAVNNNLGPLSTPEPGRNDLLEAAAALAPALAGLAEAIEALRPAAWGMSGSGSTFWLYDPQRPAETLAAPGLWIRRTRLAR